MSERSGPWVLLALVALLPLTMAIWISIVVLSQELAITPVAVLLIGVALGGLISSLIVGRLSVFLHELKHAVVANLAGNKAKRMEVSSDSGSFEYEYTTATAHLNDFIALAPYVFPLFVVPVAITFVLLGAPPLVTIGAVGVAYGIDLRTGVRDIADHQSDLTDIRGGYVVSLTYILLAHLVLGGLLIIIAGGGWNGILRVAEVLFIMTEEIIASFRR